MSTHDGGVAYEWEYEEDGEILVLTMTATYEGIILDVFNGEESILTESMTVDEWIDWMQQRDDERYKS